MNVLKRSSSYQEKFREKKKNLHMVFINLKKAYQTVPRQLIRQTLKEEGIPNRYMDIIQDMYKGELLRREIWVK